MNGGDRSMVVKAAVTGPDAFAFVGVGRDIVVAKGRRDAFPLAFKPSRPGAFHATLTLRTSGSGSGDVGESVAYELKGFAAPPEAESTMVIHAVAREACRKSFAVPNVFGRANKSAAYAVECDLDFVGGEPTCVAPKNGDAFYEMDLAPRRSGVFRGAVHFSAAGGTRCGSRSRCASRALSQRKSRSTKSQKDQTTDHRHHRRRPERPFRRHRLDVASSRSRARRHDGASDIGQPAGRAGGFPRAVRGARTSRRADADAPREGFGRVRGDVLAAHRGNDPRLGIVHARRPGRVLVPGDAGRRRRRPSRRRPPPPPRSGRARAREAAAAEPHGRARRAGG